MEVRATAKYIRVQPRKVRIIADEIRGENALFTVSKLRYHTSKGAKALHKVLVSAMANAQENHNLSPEALRISAILVDEGPRLKRMQARAMGRGNRIIKKTSHITVVVEDYEVAKAIRPHGTKAKPRPTFGAGKGRKGAAPAAKAAATETPVADAPVEEVVEEIVTPAVEAPVEEAVEAPAAEPTAEEATETATTDEAPSASDEKGAE
jgi:large subunit ribosomal protein L22